MPFLGQHSLEYLTKIEGYTLSSIRGYRLLFPFPFSMQTVAKMGKLNCHWSFLMERLQLHVSVCIYDSSADRKVGVGSLMNKASAPPLAADSLNMKEVHVKNLVGLMEQVFLNP